MTPSYLQPLFRTHYIPDHHIAPQLQYPRYPRPIRCVEGTSLEGTVSEDEGYQSIPDELPDKYAIFAPDHHSLNIYDTSCIS